MSGRVDNEVSTTGKERERRPQRVFDGISLLLVLAGGGGRRTSQEGVAEEDQATKTKISYKMGQGNPVWVQHGGKQSCSREE